jgi:16S rRNA (guanine(966)-N(2))-methyltransferase RsmD
MAFHIMSMRVIAGAAKGKRLIGPEGIDTRPLTDRVKEALFSSLGDWVTGSAVLDLYAGVGGFGIEALSRGARSAVFVESSRTALAALRVNLAASGLPNGVIIAQDVSEYLLTATERFDLIFLDPPWSLKAAAVEKVMALVDRLAEPGCEMVVNRRFSDPDPSPILGWRLYITRRYGDGKIYRYEKETT